MNSTNVAVSATQSSLNVETQNQGQNSSSASCCSSCCGRCFVHWSQGFTLGCCSLSTGAAIYEFVFPCTTTTATKWAIFSLSSGSAIVFFGATIVIYKLYSNKTLQDATEKIAKESENIVGVTNKVIQTRQMIADSESDLKQVMVMNREAETKGNADKQQQLNTITELTQKISVINLQRETAQKESEQWETRFNSLKNLFQQFTEAAKNNTTNSVDSINGLQAIEKSLKGDLENLTKKQNEFTKIDQVVQQHTKDIVQMVGAVREQWELGNSLGKKAMVGLNTIMLRSDSLEKNEKMAEGSVKEFQEAQLGLEDKETRLLELLKEQQKTNAIRDQQMRTLEERILVFSKAKVDAEAAKLELEKKIREFDQKQKPQVNS